MVHLEVSETFVSIQGESSYAGWPCFFIRLAGCNLSCRYCDTPAARANGRRVPIAELVDAATACKAAMIEITGGEPLLQPGFRELAVALRERTRKPVLVETNGSRELSLIPDGVIAIMDVKCPGSGEEGSTLPANLEQLRPGDEIKFVLVDRHDYEWARDYVAQHGLCRRVETILFSPVRGKLNPADLAGWILEDGLQVRLQIQLHKYLDMP